MDAWIHSRNPFGQTGHHFIQLLLAVIVIGNAVFFFISFKQLPASLFRLIILNYLINLLRCRRALDNRSQNASDISRMSCRKGLHRSMQASSYHAA